MSEELEFSEQECEKDTFYCYLPCGEAFNSSSVCFHSGHEFVHLEHAHSLSSISEQAKCDESLSHYSNLLTQKHNLRQGCLEIDFILAKKLKELSEISSKKEDLAHKKAWNIAKKLRLETKKHEEKIAGLLAELDSEINKSSNKIALIQQYKQQMHSKNLLDISDALRKRDLIFSSKTSEPANIQEDLEDILSKITLSIV